jgi:hypothetical protein
MPHNILGSGKLERRNIPSNHNVHSVVFPVFLSIGGIPFRRPCGLPGLVIGQLAFLHPWLVPFEAPRLSLSSILGSLLLDMAWLSWEEVQETSTYR